MRMIVGLGTAVALALTPAASQTATGFLAPGEFDVVQVLEPAPRRGDPRFEADRKIFRATRVLAGTPRWQMATSDVDYSAAAMMRNFSCAVGARLTPASAPKLLALAQRAGADTGRQTSHAKDVFQRERPFVHDRGPVCQPREDLVDRRLNRTSFDYPSGHTTWGWTWALILTAAVPERAQQILARGRAYGDSRFVCGVHNESAVEAGFHSASATMVLVSTKPAYQAALTGVRGELAALRASGAASVTGCEAEDALVTQRVMPKLDKRSRR